MLKPSARSVVQQSIAAVLLASTAKAETRKILVSRERDQYSR
jgi:hypothetical protein